MKPGSKYNLEVFPNIEMLNRAAANFIIEAGKKAVSARGRFVIALSGGRTPLQLYARLSKYPYLERMPWKKTFVFWGDERCVPLDDEQNNAHQAKTILLDKTIIPLSHVYPVPVSLPPAQAAAGYENEIKDFFGKEQQRFDLTLLGLGENGHTASLFPGTKVIDEQAEGVREVYVENGKMFRITMTAPLINQSRNILFLVTGGNKTRILEKVLSASYQPEVYPAQLIHPQDGRLYWFADRAAASLVKNVLF